MVEGDVEPHLDPGDPEDRQQHLAVRNYEAEVSMPPVSSDADYHPHHRIPIIDYFMNKKLRYSKDKDAMSNNMFCMRNYAAEGFNLLKLKKK